MAILTSKTELSSGEQLTAQVVNDISETAVEAYKLAQTAKDSVKTLINESIGQALTREV